VGQWGDLWLGDGVVDSDVFGADDLEAVELGRMEAELFADFLADAAVGGGIELDFGGDVFFAYEGQVLGDAGGSGFGFALVVFFDFSRRSGVCGSGGCGLFCVIAFEKELELGGIELFAGGSEDAAGEGIDGLLEEDDLCGLVRDDGIAFGDFC
jgi:hypothetical protein